MRSVLLFRNGLFWVLCIGVAAVSARLLIPEIARAAPHMAYHFDERMVAFYSHIFFSIFALMALPVQLSPKLRARAPHLHRWTGRMYVLFSIIGGLGGLWLAATTRAEPVAALGFGLLALVWIYTTACGFLAARARDFGAHRRWMLRSAALAFAAVTLRIYLPLGLAFGLPFEVIYTLVAWACWVPNLLFVEWALLERPVRPRRAA